MDRVLEHEVMDTPEEARAYARAKYEDVIESAVRRLLELAGDAPGLRMVDLGTGPGSIPIMVARERPTWQITGVDASKEMIKIAQISTKMARLSDQVKLHLGNAKETGLPGGSFDIVFSNNFLHHMPDAGPLWREVKRLAAPGALLFVRDLRRPDSEAAAHELVKRHASQQSELNQKGFFESLLSAFKIEEAREQLDAAGLTAIRVEPTRDYFLDIWGRLN